MDIGSLGLDSKDIEAALDRVGKKLGQTAAQTEGLNMAVTAAAAAIAIWAANVVSAKDKAEQLDKAIEGVARALSAPEFNTESGLETRLKEVDSLLNKLQGKKSLSDVIIENVSDFFTGEDTDKKEDAAGTMAIRKRQEIEEQLAAKIQEQTGLIKMRRQGLQEEVEIAMVQIKFDEMREKLAGSMTNARQEALKLQQQELTLSIRQKYEQERIAETKKITDQIQKENDEEAARVLSEEEEDNKHLYEHHKKQAKEAGDAKRDAIAGAEKLVLEEQKRLALNQKVTEELKAQTQEMKAARTGNPTDVKRAQMENEYDRKIKDAVRRGDKKSENELIAQRDMEREDLDVEESKKTPRQKSDERKAGRKIQSEIDKARARERELERRAQRGADSEAIANRRKIGADEIDRAKGVERVRNEPKVDSKGFDDAARKNLEDIATAFRNKGK